MQVCKAQKEVLWTGSNVSTREEGGLRGSSDDTTLQSVQWLQNDAEKAVVPSPTSTNFFFSWARLMLYGSLYSTKTRIQFFFALHCYLSRIRPFYQRVKPQRVSWRFLPQGKHTSCLRCMCRKNKALPGGNSKGGGSDWSISCHLETAAVPFLFCLLSFLLLFFSVFLYLRYNEFFCLSLLYLFHLPRRDRGEQKPRIPAGENKTKRRRRRWRRGSRRQSSRVFIRADPIRERKPVVVSYRLPLYKSRP